VIPVHFLVPAFAFWWLRTILAPSSSLGNAAAVEEKAAAVGVGSCGTYSYSEEGPWLVDMLRETFVNALFVVGLLVVPELLRINGVRRGYALLILYPIYSFGVDADGKVSEKLMSGIVYDVIFIMHRIPYHVHSNNNYYAQFHPPRLPLSQGERLRAKCHVFPELRE